MMARRRASAMRALRMVDRLAIAKAGPNVSQATIIRKALRIPRRRRPPARPFPHKKADPAPIDGNSGVPSYPPTDVVVTSLERAEIDDSCEGEIEPNLGDATIELGRE